MALIKDYELTIKYIAEYPNPHEELVNILTEEQISTIDCEIGKVFTIENVYCMVDVIQGSKNCINFSVNVYKDEQKTSFLESRQYSFIPDVATGSTNFIKQAYEHLKTLKEYEGAIDC